MSVTFEKNDIPNRLDHNEAQARWYAHWEAQGYFHSEPDPNRQPFTIVIPPPNVTGALHLGHALNNSLQDILIRFRRMQGYNVLWMPGTDHAGIATQAVVERRLMEEEGLSRHDLGREQLVERIWQWKAQYESRIITQLKMMGASCDWDRLRFTLDDTCAKAVRRTFFDLFHKQLLYRGKRLVNWDTFLQTAVSDDEVVQKTIKGSFWHFRYPVENPQAGEPDYVTIATTRPETMLGDTAVAVHPDPAGALDKLAAELGDRLAAAPKREKPAIQEQLDALVARRETHLPGLIQLRDMARDGRKLILPLLDREIPLVCDEWAKPELGTGCVKITPAHDPNDYEVGLRQNLPMINILNPDGTLNENAGPYQGLTIRKARERVVADLEAAQLLGEIEDREIELPHSDRSKTPIEPYLADQWFIKMDQLAQSAMDAVTDGQVEINPERYAKTYLDWLSEKRDWPVSRQLWWGHQIPIWSQPCEDDATCQRLIAALDADPDVRSGKLTYQVEPDVELAAAHRSGGTVQGAEKFRLPVATIHVCLGEEDEAAANRLEAAGYTREQDVLDTWFSSALWPHSTLGWPEQTPELAYYYPTSVLITSRDIITLWVARMVLAGLNNMGQVPFERVFIHPKILDGEGETMSKSKGNGVDPLDVIEKFGADALRYGLAYLTTETQDVRMPVQFECPHCEELINQTRGNRELPRIDCPKCNQPFSTQWAREKADQALPRAAVVSERFELARNFCNKLWNASRFSLINLEGYSAAGSIVEELSVEDRWILSRLATVTEQVTASLENFGYAEAMRLLYDFSWDEFCSFYVEMAKPRLQDEQTRPVAQRVLAYTLDTLMRLLHPAIPFITEEVWQRLNQAAPERGIDAPATATESIMIAPWPQCDPAWKDPAIESRFARFQAVLGALREIRSRQNIAPRESIEYSVRCSAEAAAELEPMQPYFLSMANASSQGIGPQVQAPKTSVKVDINEMEVYVDLRDLIDPAEEKARLEKLIEKLGKAIQGKAGKLKNQNFLERAPAEVVQNERDGLAQLQEQQSSAQAALDELVRQHGA